jgi:aminoglycoside 6'-N-acetyltransferase I
MIRTIHETDRNEWLRMRLALFEDGADDREIVAENLAEMAAFFDAAPQTTVRPSGPLLPAVVFVSVAAPGRLNGFLELSVRNYAEGCDGPTPYIEAWYVDADARVRGIGRALVVAAEAWARTHGYTEIASDALVDNTGSLLAHAALGFAEVERIVVFRKDL